MILRLIALAIVLAATSPAFAENPFAGRPNIPLQTRPAKDHSPIGKIDPQIAQLVSEMTSHRDRNPGNLSYAQFSNTFVHVSADGTIHVLLRLSAVNDTALATLTQTGVARIDRSLPKYGLVQAWIPFDKMAIIAALDIVEAIDLPDYARPRSGSVQTEGDAIILANQVRDSLGFTGAGVRVGVISDGAAGIFDSVASGDIPAGTDTSCDPSGSQTSGVHCNAFASSIDAGSEGTAMLEIIYDIAPGAALYLTNASSEAEMISAIEWLSTPEASGGAGVDIIVDDLGFYQQPFFEDGTIALAAQAAVDAGVLFVSAAGNDGTAHVQEFFNDADGDGFHDFTTGANSYAITIPALNVVAIDLQWNDPFTSAVYDLDLYVDLYANADADPTQYLRQVSATQSNVGKTPEISLIVSNIPAPGQSPQDIYGFMFIEAPSGTPSSVEIEFFPMYAGAVEYQDPADSIFGHPAAAGVIAVGAIGQDEPGNDDIQPYSSQGPSTVLTVARNKPDIVSIDNVSVTANGGFFTPFPGTSAAAPHAAACLALIMEAAPSLTPSEIQQALADGAIDLGADGFDSVFGYGRTNCYDAVSAARATTPTPPATEPPASEPEPEDPSEEPAEGSTDGSSGATEGDAEDPATQDADPAADAEDPEDPEDPEDSGNESDGTASSAGGCALVDTN